MKGARDVKKEAGWKARRRKRDGGSETSEAAVAAAARDRRNGWRGAAEGQLRPVGGTVRCRKAFGAARG